MALHAFKSLLYFNVENHGGFFPSLCKIIKRTPVIFIIARFTVKFPAFFKSFYLIKIFTYKLNPTGYAFLDTEASKTKSTEINII